MRTLNDYFIDAGLGMNLQSVGSSSDHVTIPDAGVLSAIVVPATVIDAATVLTVHRFDAVTSAANGGALLTATIPLAHAADTPLELEFGAVATGDEIHIETAGTQNAAT